MTRATSAKLSAARLSILTALGLALIKFATGVLTGSLAVLSSAIDSLLDLLMSGINFMAIRHAEQPADACHPYGHGKFETLSSIFQSFVIAASGAWIIYEAVQRLMTASPVTRTGIGIVVMSVSMIASFIISRHLRSVAASTDSTALQADALHFAMDVYTNLALLAALVAITFLELPWLDPVMSILVAVYILYEAFKLLRHGLRDILDEQLPETVRSEIETLIKEHKHELFGYHNLRTRRAGSQKLIDFHLTVCKHLSVEEAHDITDHIEKKIGEKIHGTDVTIHVEPCRRHNCPGRANCLFDSVRIPGEEDAPRWLEDGKGDNQTPAG